MYTPPFFPTRLYIPFPFARRLFFPPSLACRLEQTRRDSSAAVAVINRCIFRGPGRACRCQLELLLGNLPFYFRVRIGPEALQLSPPFVLYVPGLMQARRLRLNHRHRQLSTRCTGNQEQIIRS